MNSYVISALIAFILFAMGLIAISLGISAYRNNKTSNSSKFMLVLLICVFLWDFGYAWMGLCFDSNMAYVARAIALLGVYLYCYYLNRYMVSLIKLSQKKMIPYYIVIGVLGVVSWSKIIQKDAVEFQRTPWGYWYTSAMSWGRIVQFACVITAMVTFYIILSIGLKKATLKRERYIYKGYLWFGPILFAGYLLDTLFPSIFKTAAIPGSSIGAFFSTILLYRLCRENDGYGISEDNISEYVFQDVKLPVIISDYNKKIALYNNCAPSFFDYDEANANGLSFEEYLYNLCVEYHKEHGKSVFEEDILSFNSKKRGLIEFKFATTDVYDKFDELMYSIYFVQDITKEQANLRSLEESRKIAEDANMAKSNFLANTSHEIRTPMNAILGLSEIILQNDPDNTSADKIQEIKNAANNLLGIINDILDISKIESGKYEIIPDNYSFSSMLNNVCTLIKIRLQESGLKFDINIDETLPEKVYGDETRVQQILLNILGNAVKFTKQGFVSFNITWDKNEINPTILINISDTGIGIKEEDIEKIFGVFNQVDTRRNRSVQGSGLGLAISKELAKLMDGDITVDSIYNEGSTFRIHFKQTVNNYIPIGEKICKAIIDGTYSSAISQSESEEILRPDTKVLIVDDVDMNLVIAQGLLQKYEINADIAMSGKEAVELTKNKKYDLIFMDHMMPEMDGIDTTKAIRSIPDGLCKDTPIIALTANAQTEAKVLFKAEGLQDFLAKPIEPKNLDDIILKWT